MHITLGKSYRGRRMKSLRVCLSCRYSAEGPPMEAVAQQGRRTDSHVLMQLTVFMWSSEIPNGQQSNPNYSQGLLMPLKYKQNSLTTDIYIFFKKHAHKCAKNRTFWTKYGYFMPRLPLDMMLLWKLWCGTRTEPQHAVLCKNSGSVALSCKKIMGKIKI